MFVLHCVNHSQEDKNESYHFTSFYLLNCNIHFEMERYYKEFYSSDHNFDFEVDTDEDFIETEANNNAYDYGTMGST